jgi:hypothetical protein
MDATDGSKKTPKIQDPTSKSEKEKEELKRRKPPKLEPGLMLVNLMAWRPALGAEVRI